MKIILGICCLVMSAMCYIKPELLNDTNIMLGTIYIVLASLCFDREVKR